MLSGDLTSGTDLDGSALVVDPISNQLVTLSSLGFTELNGGRVGILRNQGSLMVC